MFVLVAKVKPLLLTDIPLHMYHVVEQAAIMVVEKEEMLPKAMDQIIHIYVVVEVAEELHILQSLPIEEY